MFKNKKLRLFIIFLSLAIIVGIACWSFSVFSDNSSIHREGTTGTLAIELNSMIDLVLIQNQLARRYHNLHYV